MSPATLNIRSLVTLDGGQARHAIAAGVKRRNVLALSDQYFNGSVLDFMIGCWRYVSSSVFTLWGPWWRTAGIRRRAIISSPSDPVDELPETMASRIDDDKEGLGRGAFSAAGAWRTTASGTSPSSSEDCCISSTTCGSISSTTVSTTASLILRRISSFLGAYFILYLCGGGGDKSHRLLKMTNKKYILLNIYIYSWLTTQVFKITKQIRIVC